MAWVAIIYTWAYKVGGNVYKNIKPIDLKFGLI
jgi:hypothetical protein